MEKSKPAANICVADDLLLVSDLYLFKINKLSQNHFYFKINKLKCLTSVWQNCSCKLVRKDDSLFSRNIENTPS